MAIAVVKLDQRSSRDSKRSDKGAPDKSDGKEKSSAEQAYITDDEDRNKTSNKQS